MFFVLDITLSPPLTIHYSRKIQDSRFKIIKPILIKKMCGLFFLKSPPIEHREID